MRKTIYITTLMYALMVATLSCTRDPIVYPTANYYIAISSENELESTPSKIYGVNFYDATDGKLALGKVIYVENHPDNLPRGGYLEALTPGDYVMLVYRYDTKNTKINNDANISKAYANTDTYSYNKNVPIIKMPDHMYVDLREISIPYVTEDDGPYIIESHPSTMLETYSVTIHGIKDLSKAVTADLYISGQAPGRWLGPGGGLLDDNAIISWRADLTPRTRTTNGETIYTEYTTFGQSTTNDRALLTLYVTGPGGTTTWGQMDVSEIIESGKKDIDVTIELEVTENQQSGFDPEAEKWIPEVTDIELE